MSIPRRLKRLALGGLAVALAGTAGAAYADCDANGAVAAGGSGHCYQLRGSDTLFDIMTEAIRQARLDGGGASALALAARDLYYLGTGSGNAENALRAQNGTAIGSQSIGPMSRNMRPSIIDPLSPDFIAATTASTCNPGTSCGHAAWTATTPNVVGLDAAVFVVNGSVPLANVTFATFTDNQPVQYTATAKSVINRANLATSFGNAGAFQSLAATFNYDSIMSVILSGVDGSGTLAACADPRRVQAVQDLASLLGVTTIQHLYRRDDNSGTTDTFKDRIMVVANTGALASRYLRTGGRFCNGTAVGGIAGATLQQGICSANRNTVCTADPTCAALTAGSKCLFNLNNQDFDPIRRPCVNPDPTVYRPTSCSDMTSGLPCTPDDANPSCTQGLVVALSDTDVGATDVTTSIGRRVGSDPAAGFIGYAGREAALGTGAKGIAINTIRATDENVRNSNYLLARRLYIQNTFAPSVLAQDIPTDTGGGGGAAGGADQLAKEQLLWTGFLSDRFRMDPIVRQFNFIRCDPTADGGDPSTLSNNLCSLEAFAPTASAFGALWPSGALSGANGGAKAISHDGLVPTTYTTGTRTTGWSAGRVCTVASPCSCATVACLDAPLVAAVNTGSAAPCMTSVYSYTGTTYNVPPGVATNGTCPAQPLRPVNAACSRDSDCSAGLRCADILGHGTPGEAHSLYCCDPATNATCNALPGHP